MISGPALHTRRLAAFAPAAGAVALGALGLGGCGALRHAAPAEAATLEIRGDAESVSITSRWDGIDPYPAAVRYCRDLGRVAKFRNSDGRRTTFDCIAPGA